MKKIILIFLLLLFSPIVYANIDFEKVTCRNDGTIRIDIEEVYSRTGTDVFNIKGLEKRPIILKEGVEVKLLRYEKTGNEVDINGTFYRKEYGEIKPTTKLTTYDQYEYFFISNTFHTQPNIMGYDIVIEYKDKKDVFEDVECPAFQFSCELIFINITKCEQKGNEITLFLDTRGLDQPRKINPVTDFDWDLRTSKKVMDRLPKDARYIKANSEIKFSDLGEFERVNIRASKILGCDEFYVKKIGCDIINETVEEIESVLDAPSKEEPVVQDAPTDEDEKPEKISFFRRIISWFKRWFE